MIERDQSETIRSVTAAELSIMAELYAEPSVRLKAADEETSGSFSSSPDLSSSNSPIVSDSSSIGVADDEGDDDSGDDSGDSSGSGAAEEERVAVSDSDTENSDTENSDTEDSDSEA